MYYILFIHSSVNGHLGHFHVLAIVNSALVNIGGYVSFWITVFSGYMPRSGNMQCYSQVNSTLLTSLSVNYCFVLFSLKQRLGTASSSLLIFLVSPGIKLYYIFRNTFFFSFIFISWRLITLQYCSGFFIQWHELDMDLHVFPIPIPPPTSLSAQSLWVFPVHQAWALVSCIQKDFLWLSSI